MRFIQQPTNANYSGPLIRLVHFPTAARSRDLTPPTTNYHIQRLPPLIRVPAAAATTMNFGIFVAVLCLATASLAAYIKADDAVTTTHCTDERDPNFKLSTGEQGPGPRGTCMLVKCEGIVDGKPVLTAIGCGVFVATAGCTATGYDNTKLYPDCCPSEICSR